MGSSISGLYKGTRGAQAAANTPRAMHLQVNNWAENEAQRLQGISPTQRKKFNTASIVCDTETGQQFFGKNNGLFQGNEPRNPQLFGENGILPKESLNGYAVGNCAEVQAINRALNAGAKLKNLSIFTINAAPKGFGEPKKACENCTFAFKGKIKDNHTGWKS